MDRRNFLILTGISALGFSPSLKALDFLRLFHKPKDSPVQSTRTLDEKFDDENIKQARIVVENHYKQINESDFSTSQMLHL